MDRGSIFYVAIQPSGTPIRVVNGPTVAACWNSLAASSNRSIAELKRAGWRVAQDVGQRTMTPHTEPRP
jgi:hypothetical protein